MAVTLRENALTTLDALKTSLGIDPVSLIFLSKVQLTSEIENADSPAASFSMMAHCRAIMYQTMASRSAGSVAGWSSVASFGRIYPATYCTSRYFLGAM